MPAIVPVIGPQDGFSMESLSLLSPAKLNLYLRILRKRPDGYHDLLTLFHRISLCDRLVLRKRKAGFSLKCNLPGLPTDEGNLVTRAYQLLQKRCPSVGGVSVRLYKKIPVGAGLGGGSSNAASFLLGMNRLYRLKLPLGALMSLGRKLGADVPFFLAGVNQAVAYGRGDRLRPRICKGLWRFLLLLPERPLSTQGVYQAYRFYRASP